MDDKEIIETADRWERERLHAQRRRWDLIKSLIGWILGVGGSLAIFGGVIFGTVTCFHHMRAEDTRIRDEKDQAFVDCVETLGLKKCKRLRGY